MSENKKEKSASELLAQKFAAVMAEAMPKDLLTAYLERKLKETLDAFGKDWKAKDLETIVDEVIRARLDLLLKTDAEFVGQVDELARKLGRDAMALARHEVVAKKRDRY